MRSYKKKSCVLVIDFGSQYTQLLLRRIHELGVYALICSCWHIDDFNIIDRCINGIILSGGPYSVLQCSAPRIPKNFFQLGIPILGICYGMQVMTDQLGGCVQNNVSQNEFGNTQIKILSENDLLIKNIYDHSYSGQFILDVWMSHKDIITTIPSGFKVVGITNNNHIAIISHEICHFYGIQFHPEVTHTKQGKNILNRFIKDICHCQSVLQSINVIDNIVMSIKEKVGNNNDKIILAFSGGIDSCVTALLLKRAVGSARLLCIFINNGLLSHREFNRIKNFFDKYYGLNIICCEEEKRFFNALIGVIDPEIKRRIIGRTFIEVFEEKIRDLVNIKWLAQGTICSDVIESGSLCFGITNAIKSHHNVGGLPDLMNIKLLEPIRTFFKDEVCRIGLDLGLPKDLVYRYPFPGPGFAIRILGEVKKEYCDILRQSDDIFLEELEKEKMLFNVSQAFSIFLPIFSVGIQGDKRQYKWVIVLRAIETTDFMTASWVKLPYDVLDRVSNRIVNEIQGISRVVYDISSKPPATIEWE